MTSHHSPPESFTPRKEFLKQSAHSLSSFALLTFSASSLIRLYSFPPPVVSSLRRYLDERRFTAAYREDTTNNYCEFTLQGKPWSNSKAIATERLLTNVLAIVLECGFILLSPLDYGREQDDRIALAFSKPSTHSQPGSSNSRSPIPTNATTSNHASSITVPFAVSFASATALRVIGPPLHSTPAILGAVRRSWPRGVVSEKKIGDSCYEFKLKGYRWFQEDTFATDSLRHILSLLESLDSHSFTLLTSLSLSNHSRVKDLWIFTGLSDEPHQDLRLSSTADLRLPDSPPVSPSQGTSEKANSPPNAGPISVPVSPVGGHRKTASTPARYSPDPFGAHHTRAATDGHTPPPTSPSRHRGGGSLRKPAPRAQIPVSISDTSATTRNNAGQRLNLPSTVGSSLNMTGVGTGATVLPGTKPDVQFPVYSVPHSVPEENLRAKEGVSSGNQQVQGIIAPIPVLANQSESRVPNSSFKLKRRTPPDISPPEAQYLEAPVHTDSPAPSPKHSTPPIDQPRTPSPPQASPPPSPVRRYGYNTGETPTSSTLLGPSAFRNNTGEGRETTVPEGFRDSAFTTGSELKSYEIPIKWTGPGPEPKRSDSSGPTLPGAWAPTPVPEIEEELFAGIYKGEKTPEKQDPEVQIKSPELVMQQDGGRKSEAGVVGVLPEKEKPNKLKRASEGWVMVNVEGQVLPVSKGQTKETDSRSGNKRGPGSPDPVIHSGMSSPEEETPANGSNPLVQSNGTVSPAAKAIAVIDAVDAKEKEKARSSSPAPTFKRLLSISRKEKEEKSKDKVGLRQRWKKLASSSKNEG